MTRTILNLTEVADLTGVPVDTLRYWRKRDEGPPSFKLGRRVVYDRAAVDAWIDEQRRATGGGSAA